MLARHSRLGSFRASAGLLLALLAVTRLAAQETGRIEGIVRRGGEGVGGVNVVLVETGASATLDTTVTGPGGGFVFTNVPAGTYELAFALGDNTSSETVVVEAGRPTLVEEVVDWELNFAETITVVSASRGLERIVDAPAAVTTVSQREIARAGAPGQLPRLLEFTPGVETAQSGVYDFNVNARGFNSLLTRRIQVLIDGRDTAAPVTASQEWHALGFLAEDLERMELLRGPSAALYGPNSFNGVLNIVTKAPRQSQGGALRLVAGDLDTLKAALRWAGRAGENGYFKVLGSHIESDDYTRSRNVSTEYPGPPIEAVPLSSDGVELDSFLARYDHYFGDDHVLTLEAGRTDGGGETLLSGVTRFEITELQRGWGRINWSAPKWNALAYFNHRDGNDQVSLSAGGLIDNSDSYYQVEVQAHQGFAGDRGRWVGGGSYREENLNSTNSAGDQTLIPMEVSYDKQAIFNQVDYELTDRLKLVLALRFDDSELHDAQLSPKGALLFGLAPGHNLRLSYNEAFQVGNGLEFFIGIPAGPTADLSAIEDAYAAELGGVSLGLDTVPALALGNRHLKVEQIKSFEVGYSGILGHKVFLTVDYYQNRMQDFITDLLPGVNPTYGPYEAPAGIDPAVAAAIEATLNAIPGFTNDPETGAPLIVFSYGNTARIESQGLEVALQAQVRPRWLFDFNYSWFDFDIKRQDFGVVVSPNAPEHKFGLGLVYQREKWDAALRYRWVDDFNWATGVFVGPVPSYEVVNLNARYALTDHWEIGLNVSNLFDDVHYEAFGGDLLRRRSLAQVTYSW